MGYFEDSGAHSDADPSPSAEDEYLSSLEPEETVLMTHGELHDNLKLLTARQRFVVELRYGLRDGTEYGVVEIANMMGLHHSVIQEYADTALRKLAAGS